MAIKYFLILIAVFFLLPLFTLSAQNAAQNEEHLSSGYFINIENGEKIFYQRLTWKKVEYTIRYEVIIQKIQEGKYIEHLREFTQDNLIIVSLPADKYRFQVIPYDIMDNPGKGSEWMYIEVHAAVQPVISGVIPEFIPSTQDDVSGYSLKIAGNNFTDKTTLTVKSPDGTLIEPEILDVNSDHIKIKIDEEDLIPGMYEFVIRNPGGLEENLNMLIMPIQKAEAPAEPPAEQPVKQEPEGIPIEPLPEYLPHNKMLLYATVSWAPPLILIGDDFYNLETAFRAQISVGLQFRLPKSFFIGPELTVFMPAWESGINLVFTKWFMNELAAANFRIGASYPVENFSFNNISINAGASFNWRFNKLFMLDFGADFSYLMDDKNCYVSPKIGAKFAF